jgi:hypothetical protein
MSDWPAQFERRLRADLNRVERQILIRWCVMLAAARCSPRCTSGRRMAERGPSMQRPEVPLPRLDAGR